MHPATGIRSGSGLRYGIEHVCSYERYDEMLAADVADAVYIALSNSIHADYTIRAARAGKKPSPRS